MSAGLEPLCIRAPDFEAAAELETETPTLSLRGNADGGASAPLDALIGELHHALVASHARAVAVDLRGLEFMTAACFNVLVKWIGLVSDESPEHRYALRFHTNATIPWQRRSLRTLSCFATGIVSFEPSTAEPADPRGAS